MFLFVIFLEEVDDPEEVLKMILLRNSSEWTVWILYVTSAINQVDPYLSVAQEVTSKMCEKFHTYATIVGARFVGGRDTDKEVYTYVHQKK